MPTKSKDRTLNFRCTIFQIIVKGEARNKTLDILLEGLREKLIAGEPLSRADHFGTIVRSISGIEIGSPSRGLHLSLVKYNSRNTGLSWDLEKNELLASGGRVTAQKTELLIFTKEHVAIHFQKSHGPSPAQVEHYLNSILNAERESSNIDCTIEVNSLKRPNLVSEIKSWKVIKKFSLHVYRPNPDGSIKAKKIKALLDESNADKVDLGLSAKASRGIDYAGIKDLVEEGQHLTERGQGRVEANGVMESGEKRSVDSKEQKVRNFEFKMKLSELENFAGIAFERLKQFFKTS